MMQDIFNALLEGDVLLGKILMYYVSGVSFAASACKLT